MVGAGVMRVSKCDQLGGTKPKKPKSAVGSVLSKSPAALSKPSKAPDVSNGPDLTSDSPVASPLKGVEELECAGGATDPTLSSSGRAPSLATASSPKKKKSSKRELAVARPPSSQDSGKGKGKASKAAVKAKEEEDVAPVANGGDEEDEEGGEATGRWNWQAEFGAAGEKGRILSMLLGPLCRGRSRLPCEGGGGG